MQVSFCGLNENLHIGRMAIRDVKQIYQRGFVSNSRYDTFSECKNKTISNKLANMIMNMRDIVDYEKRLGKDGYTAVEKAVRETGAANCGEQAILVSRSLNNSGIRNKVVSMLVYKKESGSFCCVDGHSFCVIGMDDDAFVTKPETWGKDAVIVDLWAGNVEKASKALKKYESMLNYDKNENQLIFSSDVI